MNISHRRRVASLERNATNSEAAQADIWVMAATVQLMFEYNTPKQAPGESRDSYEARLVGVPVRWWKGFCRELPDHLIVAVRDCSRKIDAAPGDEAARKAAMEELMARIGGESE